ncbi:MAG: hypothetical protein HKN94_10210, partial [Acidimicrobiales bacterium]|nr:hypothetical protein [Acidimicrobiales bacterium]
GVTVEPSGTAIEALGLRLEGYKLELTSAQPNFFLAANRLGEDASSAYAMESAQMFLADVDGGVLLLFADGADEDARATALGRLGDMVETAELLGPLNFPSPSFPKSGEPASRPELGVNDPELPLLEAQHRPIDPGRYQVTRLGDTFALDVGEEWWAESNTRGFVELASADSFAPGNNDLAFVAGLDRGLFSISGPNFVGEPDDLTDLPSWLESPPDGLTVSDIQEVDVGGRSATRFDISIADGADCQEAAPCEYWLFSPVETALVIKSGFDVRIWHIEDHEFAPLTIMTSTTGSTWIDEAGALVDTIEFLG